MIILNENDFEISKNIFDLVSKHNIVEQGILKSQYNQILTTFLISMNVNVNIERFRYELFALMKKIFGTVFGNLITKQMKINSL